MFRPQVVVLDLKGGNVKMENCEQGQWCGSTEVLYATAWISVLTGL